VIIPRGSSNTIAINLIVLNLLFQLKALNIIDTEEIEKKMELSEKKDTEEEVENKNHPHRHNSIVVSIIDLKYNFLNGAVIVYKEENKIKTLKRIFQDLVEHLRPEYSK
jgi:hypothetical protein